MSARRSSPRPAVAVHQGPAAYPTLAPFDPHVAHPEYLGPVGSEPNAVYDGVRRVLELLYPPGEVHGTGANWNPLGQLIEPGQTVFIKPNLVDDAHRFGGDVWSVITHPSVVRAVADYVALALRGDGRIIIGDNPHVDCQWDGIAELYGAAMLCARIAEIGGIDVEMVDLRSWHMPDLRYYGWRQGRAPLTGDPRGSHTVTLHDSYLDGRPWWLFRGTFNERAETIRAHRGGHRYTFAGTIHHADTYVSIPKLKTHAKVGATLNLKGLIGTITDKNSLVHWTIGYPRFGGDEYPTPERRSDYARLYWQHAVGDLLPSRVQLAVRDRFEESAVGRRYRRLVTTQAQDHRLLRGAWDGNDTTWRMTADVHDAFIGMPGRPRRRTFSIIDGIVGGDTDGPHFPHRIAPGALVGGEDLLATDMVAARYMDLDIDDIAYLRTLESAHRLPRAEIEVRGIDDPATFFGPDRTHLGFRPPNRWPNLSMHGLAPAGDLLEEQRRRPTPGPGEAAA